MLKRLKDLVVGGEFEYECPTGEKRVFKKNQVLQDRPNALVIKCYEEESNSEYVIKVIDREHVGGGELTYSNDWDTMYNSNILFYEITSTDTEQREGLIITPYRGINLKVYRSSLKYVTVCTVLQIIIDCVNALKSVHNRHLIHCDVKPENIFVMESFTTNNSDIINSIPLLTVTLGDFGSCERPGSPEGDFPFCSDFLDSQIDDTLHSSISRGGTFGYIAPECYDNQLGTKSDIWSLGSTISRFIFPNLIIEENQYRSIKENQEHAKETNNRVQLEFKQIHNINEFEKDEHGWQAIRELLSNMLKFDYDTRYDLDDIYNYFYGTPNVSPGLTLSSNFEHLRKEWINNKNIALISLGLEKNVLMLLPNDSKLKHDKDIVEEAIKKYTNSLQYLDNSFKEDRHIVEIAVQRNGLSLQYAHTALKSDKIIVEKAVKQDGSALRFADENCKRDYNIVMLAVSQNGDALRYADTYLKCSEKIALKAIEVYPPAFSHADECLKRDEKFIMDAIKIDAATILFIDDSLKQDKEFTKRAINQNIEVLNYVESDNAFKEYSQKDNRNSLCTEELILENGTVEQTTNPTHNKLLCSYELEKAHPSLRKDLGYVLESIKNNPRSILFVDEVFKNNKEFLIQAMYHNGNAMEFIDEKNRNDFEIVMAAVSQNGHALQFASEELKENLEIVLEAVKESGSALEYSHPNLKKNEKVVITAVKQNGYAIQYADTELQQKEEIVLNAVHTTGYALGLLYEEFRGNEKIVTEAIKQNIYSLRFANNSLLQDENFMIGAIKLNHFAFTMAHSMIKKDPEFIMKAKVVNENVSELIHQNPTCSLEDYNRILEKVKLDGTELEHVDEIFKQDREIVMAAVSQNGYALKFAPEHFKRDRQVVLAAAFQDLYALELADTELTSDQDFILEAVKRMNDKLHDLFFTD